MASWFKKHFSCIKREPSAIIVTSVSGVGVAAASNKKKNGNLLKSEVDLVDAKQHQRIETIILKNDLTRNSNSLLKKNSNEYRDYGKNAESQYIAENYFKMRNNSIKQSNNNLGKKIKIDPNDNHMQGCNSSTRVIANNKPRELPRVIREYNNNMNLQELMKKLRACNECVSQKRICRVHSAMVSKVNMASRSVTVEWYERGETKGKEVELDMILQLNPELFNITEPQIIQQPPPQPTNLQRVSSQSSPDDYEDELIDVADENEDIVPQQVNPISGGTLPIRQTNTATKSANATQGAIRVRNTGIVNPQINAGRSTRSNVQPIQVQQTNGQDHSENIPPPTSVKQRVANNRATINSQTQNQNMTTAAITSNAGQRRSYVVKEVEKLKENREKRRARQAELKEEKVALMNMDPGNPNWELAAMIREYQSSVEFRPLVDGIPVKTQQITVCVRKRPISRKEATRKELDVISVPNKDTLLVHEPKTKVDLTKYLENHKFRFDYAFDDTCSNELVYKYTAKPLVQTIFEGGMATCFAYGQTGSGKTHTMGGEFSGKIQDCKNGIYAMAAKDVFAFLRSPKYAPLNLVVSASFFEIYSGKVFDLLSNKQKLRVLEDGKQQVQVVGLTEKVVDSVDEVLKLIQHGNVARTSGQTSANANSSRSHAVFQIVVRPSGSMKIHGKFSFIDLAGNERGADTSSANRQTRMEGAEINKSLLALKECIRALGRQNAHLPFRVSKLTQVLRDSFIGEKSRTCMIAMISPGLNSCEHTLNTLRYADRVKELVPSDPSERLDDVEPMESDEPKNGGMNEGDLAALRSLNENDMSVELYQQHAAISELQQCEEDLIDQHKLMNEFLLKFIPESQSLYDQTNFVDYDQDSYCKRGEELFTQLADLATACKELMVDFRAKLANEEMVATKIKPGKR